MRIPGTIKCDLCGEAIEHESRAVKINVPLPAELRAQIAEQVRKNPPAILGNVLNLSIPIERIVPDSWTLEACGCVIGILPMLPEKVAEDVAHTLALNERRRQAQLAQVSRLEDL